LYNACRLGAQAASEQVGPWGDSNMSGTRRARRAATMLMHSLDDLPEFERRITALRPNLVLIGAMTICLPGAIACAKLVKEILGDRACVVLGGRHANESIYRRADGTILHHPSSPLALMAQGVVDSVFDIVVSGDGEAVVLAIGELVSSLEESGQTASSARDHLADLTATPGRWIAGAIRHGSMYCAVGLGAPLLYDGLKSPVELFGAEAAFDVFGGRRTAHVFSDTGRGCIYDCSFCSERRRVTGGPVDLNGSPERLYNQIESAVRVIDEDYPGEGASAFVEDSTLLAFAPHLVRRFVDQMRSGSLDVKLGGQLTIDQVLSRTPLLAELQEIGLTYLFIGLETTSPAGVDRMSKDIGWKKGAWPIGLRLCLIGSRNVGYASE